MDWYYLKSTSAHINANHHIAEAEKRNVNGWDSNSRDHTLHLKPMAFGPDFVDTIFTGERLPHLRPVPGYLCLASALLY